MTTAKYALQAIIQQRAWDSGAYRWVSRDYTDWPEADLAVIATTPDAAFERARQLLPEPPTIAGKTFRWWFKVISVTELADGGPTTPWKYPYPVWCGSGTGSNTA